MRRRSPKRTGSRRKQSKSPKRNLLRSRRKLKSRRKSPRRKSKRSRMLKRGAPKDDRDYDVPKTQEQRTVEEVAQILSTFNNDTKKTLAKFNTNQREILKRILIDRYAPFTPSIPTDWHKNEEGNWSRIPGEVVDYDADARVNAVEIARRALKSERTGDASLISRKVMGGKNIGDRILSLLDTAEDAKTRFRYQNNPRLLRNKIREDLGLKTPEMLSEDYTSRWRNYMLTNASRQERQRISDELRHMLTERELLRRVHDIINMRKFRLYAYYENITERIMQHAQYKYDVDRSFIRIPDNVKAAMRQAARDAGEVFDENDIDNNFYHGSDPELEVTGMINGEFSIDLVRNNELITRLVEHIDTIGRALQDPSRLMLYVRNNTPLAMAMADPEIILRLTIRDINSEGIIQEATEEIEPWDNDPDAGGPYWVRSSAHSITIAPEEDPGNIIWNGSIQIGEPILTIYITINEGAFETEAVNGLPRVV